jgi:hypothetical protein
LQHCNNTNCTVAATSYNVAASQQRELQRHNIVATRAAPQRRSNVSCSATTPQQHVQQRSVLSCSVMFVALFLAIDVSCMPNNATIVTELRGALYSIIRNIFHWNFV